jgi:transcriptional regulator with XRE-family HTH domain
VTAAENPFQQAPLAQRTATVNQLVGFNVKFFRQAAGLTQDELGQRLGGWSKGVVSAAERSWDSDRIRQFDADELAAIAGALGVPLAALFLPPPDAGTAVDYTFTDGARQMSADALLSLAVTDYQGDSKLMVAVQERINSLGGGRLMQSIEDEALRIMEEARDFAKQLIGEGSGVAQDLRSDAAERHRQVMANLVPQYEALERRVSDLRGFEREYRVRLISALEDGLRYLRAGAEDEGAFPAVLKVPPEATPKDEP